MLQLNLIKTFIAFILCHNPYDSKENQINRHCMLKEEEENKEIYIKEEELFFEIFSAANSWLKNFPVLAFQEFLW